MISVINGTAQVKINKHPKACTRAPTFTKLCLKGSGRLLVKIEALGPLEGEADSSSETVKFFVAFKFGKQFKQFQSNSIWESFYLHDKNLKLQAVFII